MVMWTAVWWFSSEFFFWNCLPVIWLYPWKHWVHGNNHYILGSKNPTISYIYPSLRNIAFQSNLSTNILLSGATFMLHYSYVEVFNLYNLYITFHSSFSIEQLRPLDSFVTSLRIDLFWASSYTYSDCLWYSLYQHEKCLF